MRDAPELDALGPLQQGVIERLQKLAAEDVVRRLWAHDASLWARDEAGQSEVRRRLGWLEAPARSRALLPELDRLVKDCQGAGYTRAVLLGMGGAALAAEVFSQGSGVRDAARENSRVYGGPGLELLALDSTHPVQVRAAARWADAGQTLFIAASKPGAAAEISAFVDFFWARARRSRSQRRTQSEQRSQSERGARSSPGDHFIAITDPGTPLDRLARERKFRQVFLADATVGEGFSALTAFGLVPAALVGVDVPLLLERAAHMAELCTQSGTGNPGLALGVVLAEAAMQGRDKITLIADPEVAPFGAWLEQLIAGSTGKQGRGLVPVDQEPSLPARKYGPDRLFVYLRFDARGLQSERARELQRSGQPVVTLNFADVHDLGAAFFTWETAAALACSMLGVNAFDQRDAQDSTERALQKVAAYRQVRVLDEGRPTWEGSGGLVYGWDFPGLNGSRALADVVRAFAAQSREGDYIAINAYLPRSERSLGQLQRLRAQILSSSGRATTLGFGPGCLHSTGQLQKGGANNGLFLLITSEPGADLEIPGQGLSFATLERAQALGDLEALLSRGRRVIRVHLVEGEVNNLFP